MRYFFVPILALLAFPLGAADKNQNSDNPQPKKPTRLYIASGMLVSGSGAPIEVRRFDALIEKAPNDGKQNCTPDQDRKVITISSGTAFLTTSSLGTLLNSKLQEKQLEDIQVSDDKGLVKITGKAKKAVTLPFTIEGPLSLTSQGYLQLKTEKMKVGKLPGLAALLGVNPEKMVSGKPVKGVQAEKDAIVFDPDLLWGLPVHGRVTRVSWQSNGLLLQFGQTRGPARQQKLTHAKSKKPNGAVATQQ